VSKKDENRTWKELVSRYNVLVRGFRSAWTLLRAVVLMYPDPSSELDIAKKRIKELQVRLSELEKKLRRKNTDGARKQLDMLEMELRVFKELFRRLDGNLRPYHIRSFCEKTHDTRDVEIKELLKYYLSGSEFSDEDADKIDFLATELCSTRVGAKRVLKSSQEIEQLLDELFDEPVRSDECESATVEEFRQAARGIQNIEEVDALLDNEIIRTMRDFKKEIRQQLANPRVLKALVVYNVTLNNRLIEIFEKETGGIKSAAQLVKKVKADLKNAPPHRRETVQAIISKAEEIARSFRKKSEETGYDLDLVVEAARTRKAIAESLERIREIGEKEDAEKKEGERFTSLSTQTLINRVFRALLSVDEGHGGPHVIPEINLDVSKMDPFRKSVFLVDLDAMGGERRMFEALQKAVVLSDKIVEEYKKARYVLSRDEIVSLVGENLELAQEVDAELQEVLDRFDMLAPSTVKVVDVMRVKSALSKSIKRLTSLARTEGIMEKKKKG